MEKIKKQLAGSNAKHPYTSVMRNYVATSTDFTMRQTEWQRSEKSYCFGLQLFDRKSTGPPKCVFRIDKCGIKNVIIEECFIGLYEWLANTTDKFVVQGPEDSIAEDDKIADKQENVIITGPDENTKTEATNVVDDKLLVKWSNTEKYYDFTGGFGSVMNRWFPLESVKITTASTPATNGGLVKTWKIPEDLIKTDMDAVNILPLRSFMLGKLDLEFKLVLQANPFQACCVMMSTIPNPYGLFPSISNWSGIKNDGSTGANLKTWPYAFIHNSSYTYVDRDVAVQRPNTIVDVRTGGQGTLLVQQKYHKTLIRNFDSSFVADMNPGIRGSWSSNLTLHVLTQLRVGSGVSPNFTCRIFYRFVGARVTGMTEAVQLGTTSYQRSNAVQMHQLNRSNEVPVPPRGRDSSQIRAGRSYKPQGGVLSMTRGVIDASSSILSTVENFGMQGRKGFRKQLNRDKPNDLVANIRVNPRPRSCFPNATGIDDAVVLALGWDELVNFFEDFKDEPKSFIDFTRIKGILSTFMWKTADTVGTEIFTWNVTPTLKDTFKWDALDTNSLRSPLGISSSAFTNYWGTIEMCFQFVKTDFHRGAVQISIQFGKKVTGDSLKSTYVKVLNVQDCSAFSVTIPYIYDTPVRTIAGTATPMYVPNLANPGFMRFDSSTIVTVKVLNELTAPNTVSSTIDVIVWIKGGRDFNLNFPRPVNTGTFINTNKSNVLLGTNNVRNVMSSNKPNEQYSYNINSGYVSSFKSSIGEDRFVVQGDEEDNQVDFNQDELEYNRITTNPHTNFADLLKIPIKLLNEFPLETTVEREFTSEGTTKKYTLQNYFCLPVAPLSYSLVDYLNHQWFNTQSTVNTVNNSIFGNSTLQQSIQCQINSMFGMYRGSLVYTVVLKQSESPVYCCYLPHDYNLRPLTGSLNVSQPVFISGSYFANAQEGVIGMGNDLHVDLASCFPGCTMIIKSVNPTEKFIVPMSTQCNWLLMNRQLATESKDKAGLLTLRENQEWFNGHLCIWSKSKVIMDLFISAGDDHDIGGFLGHHGLVNPWAQFAMRDNWRVQGDDIVVTDWQVQGSDFRLREITHKGWNSIKQLSLKAISGAAITVSSHLLPPQLKPIAVGAATFCVLGGCNEIIRFSKLINESMPMVAKIDDALQIDSVVDGSAKLILAILKEAFPMMKVSTDILDKLWSAAQHIVHSVISASWKNAAFGVFCMVVKLELFEMPDWKKVGDSIATYFSRASASEFEVQGQETEDSWMAMCETFILLLSAKMQVKATGGIREYLYEIFQYQNYRNISGLNSILTLVRTTLKAISKIFSWLLEKKDPQVVLTQLLHKQGTDIATFVEEASVYLNHFNDKDAKKKVMRVKFLTVIIQAYKLREILLQIGNPRISQHLLIVCNDVIKKAVKQRYLFQCDIVKSEPFVLCVSGASNLGKSFSVYDLAVSALQEINIPVNNPDCIFTIPAGVDYWNGYEDQPVIWYDDWCNIVEDETIKQHISQLYALKTSAPFNVPRAELENKEQIAAPNLVMMTTNNPFPKHPMIHFEEAVYRRRDLLVKFSLVNGSTSIKDFTQEQLANYEHLQVQFYDDPTKETSLSDEIFSYHDFKRIYLERLVKFHKKELVNKKAKYDKLMKAVTKTSLDHVEIGNPFESIHQLNQEEMLTKPTSEIIQEEIILLSNLVSNHMELLKIKVGDQEIFETQGLDTDRIGEDRNIFFKFTANQKESAKMEFKEERESFFGKLNQWYSKLKNGAMICERCGLHASSQGTSFWCQEHEHFLCFHCGTIMARPYRIEKDTNEYYLEVSCPLHHTNIVVRHSGFWSEIISSFISMVVFQPAFLIQQWIQGSNADSDSKMLLLLFAIKVCILKLCYLIVNKTSIIKFRVQGEVEFEEMDESFTYEVSNTSYELNDKWACNQELRNKCCNYFTANNCNISSSSMDMDSVTKFVCPHSLLVFDYIYGEGMYNIGLNLNEDMIKIPDKICLGKCVLTNVKFLNIIKTKMLVSQLMLKQFTEGVIDVIEKRFPKFTHTPEIRRSLERRSWINKIIRKDWWENYVCPGMDKAWSFIKKCLPIVAACGVIWIAHKSFEKMWNWISSLLGIETQGLISSGATPTKTRRGMKNKSGAKTTYAAQSGDENFDNKLNKLARNFICISVGGLKMVGWGFQNTSFLIPSHLGVKIEASTTFEIQFFSDVTRKLTIITSNCVFKKFEGKDLMLITVNGVAPLFQNCINFISKNNEFNYTKGVMIVADVRNLQLYEEDVNIINVSNNFTAGEGKTEWFTRQVIMYDLQEKGLCGSLLCVNSNAPVLAMHIAGSGNTNRGVGVPLNVEQFEVQGDIIDFEDTSDNTAFYGEDCLIEYEGSVAKEYIPYIPQKTTIIPSLLAPLLPPPVTKPAFLAKIGDYPFDHHPLYYGVRKNGKPPVDFPLSYINKAYSRVSKLLLTGVKIRDASILSLEQAVCGFPSLYVDDKYNQDDEDCIYYGSLPLDTSAGFPYSTPGCRKQYGFTKTTKEEWIEIQFDKGYPSTCKIHPFVMENYNKNMELRAKKIMSNNIFQDCLKDERRPMKKVYSEGGTRLFSMSNIEGSLALRQYTLDLTSFLRFNRIKNGIGVGINPESTEWTILAEVLLKNNNVFTTDFTNFGAGLNYSCGMMFAQLIIDFYSRNNVDLNPSQVNIVNTLIRELMASRHIAGNLIYGTYCGSPSGAAITVEINSFVHLMYITICWLIVGDVIKRECGFDPIYYRELVFKYTDLVTYLKEEVANLNWFAKRMTLDDLNENLVNVVYGDDGIFSISDEYKMVFNAKVINLVLKDHGIGVTDASKQEKIIASSTLKEATFLKRSFVPHELLPNTLYMAKMSIDTVTECAKWMHKNYLGAEINTLENCNSSLMLAYGHGEKYYEDYRSMLNSKLRSLGLREIEMSWMDLSVKFYPDLSFIK